VSNSNEDLTPSARDIPPPVENQLANTKDAPLNKPNQTSLPLPETQIGIVSEPFVELTSRLARDSLPTASVKLPDPEDLTVRLVNISQIQRLDELQGDTALLQTILFTSVGTVLGFLTNIFTSNQGMDKSSWIFLAFLLATCALFGALTARASRRTTELRRRLFNDPFQHSR
jgi:hypothetical protein